MPSENNLIPFNEMPPERHKEISRLGGIASGKKRRELAEMRLRLEAHLCRAEIIRQITDKIADEIVAAKIHEKLLRRQKKIERRRASSTLCSRFTAN